jgi:hypothetical protein
LATQTGSMLVAAAAVIKRRQTLPAKLQIRAASTSPICPREGTHRGSGG